MEHYRGARCLRMLLSLCHLLSSQSILRPPSPSLRNLFCLKTQKSLLFTSGVDQFPQQIWQFWNLLDSCLSPEAALNNPGALGLALLGTLLRRHTPPSPYSDRQLPWRSRGLCPNLHPKSLSNDEPCTVSLGEIKQ